MNIKFRELASYLKSVGFSEKKGSGSRFKYMHDSLDYPIVLHFHSRGDTLKVYEIDMIREALTAVGIEQNGDKK